MRQVRLFCDHLTELNFLDRDDDDDGGGDDDPHHYPPPIPNHLVPIRATLRGRPSTLCPIVWIFTRLGYRAAMLGMIWMRDGLKKTHI